MQATEHHGWGLRGFYLDAFLVLARLERNLGWRRLSAMRERIFYMVTEKDVETAGAGHLSEQSESTSNGCVTNTNSLGADIRVLTEESQMADVEAAFTSALLGSSTAAKKQ